MSGPRIRWPRENGPGGQNHPETALRYHVPRRGPRRARHRDKTRRQENPADPRRDRRPGVHSVLLGREIPDENSGRWLLRTYRCRVLLRPQDQETATERYRGERGRNHGHRRPARSGRE